MAIGKHPRYSPVPHVTKMLYQENFEQETTCIKQVLTIIFLISRPTTFASSYLARIRAYSPSNDTVSLS